jgi:CRISPR/Cas system-associated exonuclease Cas4 (RecB family)
MTTLPALVGTAVHAVLARHFQAVRNGQFRELNPERPVEMMRTAWRDAKNQLWKVNPKAHPPLFELYYDRLPSPEKLKEFAENARRAVRRVSEMTLYRSLLALNRPDYLWIDPAAEKFSEETYFEVPPYEAIAAPDLVFRSEGRVTVLDWKTGRRSDDDPVQMAAAGVWARRRLKLAGADLRGALIYLSPGETDEVIIDQPLSERAEETIRREMEEMASFLRDRERNIPLDEGSFPRHHSEGFCRRCDFQEICFGPSAETGCD